MNNKGIIKITREGNISFKLNAFYIEIFGSAQLERILSVTEFDKETGYIALETNYGEEFYCLSETVDNMDLSHKFNIKEILKDCDGWVLL